MSVIVDGVTYALPEQINQIATLPKGKYLLAIRIVKASPEKHWASLIEQQRSRLAANGNGVAPPNQRNARWDDIEKIVTPFAAAHGANDSKQFGYWFNYFWAEAREAYDLNAAGKTQLCEAFFAVLESDGNNGYQPSAQFKAMDYTQMQNVLLKVMRIGFKRVHVGPGPASSAAKAVDAKTLFACEIKENMKVARTLAIGFRGDNRDYNDLKNGGFLARARCQGLKVHSDYGLDQPWHPLNLDIYRDSLFLRKGKSKDNCLHTVISVASSLEEMLPYPLLNDASLFNLALKDPNSWDQKDLNYVTSHFLKLEIVRKGDPVTGPIDRLETRKNIFILDMSSGMGYDTAKFQADLGVGNPFPERAIDQVLPEQILAVLQVKKQYFFRRTSNPGVWTFFNVEKLGFDFLQPENVITQRFGNLVLADIRTIADRGLRNANFNCQGERQAYEKASSASAVSAVKGKKCTECPLVFPDMVSLSQHKRDAH
ncbi:MAG: hypothetical protein U0R19_06720 [Bryobacteraceae bacterium]